MLFVVGHLKMMCLAKQPPLCWPLGLVHEAGTCGLRWVSVCRCNVCSAETVADPSQVARLPCQATECLWKFALADVTEPPWPVRLSGKQHRVSGPHADPGAGTEAGPPSEHHAGLATLRPLLARGSRFSVCRWLG